MSEAKELIPVTDVTDEAAWVSAHAKAAAAVHDGLALNRPFVFVGLNDTGVALTCLADKEGLEYAAMGVLATLGSELAGPGIDHIPADVAQSLKIVIGLNHLYKMIQARANPQTPVGDIGHDAGTSEA